MQVQKTDILGVVVIVPDVFEDERGFFMESFQEQKYQEALGISERFVQDNLSLSKKRVLRGLHYQVPPFGQGKLIQVLQGRVLDVSVDIRFGSPTFGQYVAVELSEENHKQIYIPEGFAHGFTTLSDEALFSYKCTNVYSQGHERGILWNDPSLNIQWGVEDPIVSEKDQKHPPLSDIPEKYIFKQ